MFSPPARAVAAAALCAGLTVFASEGSARADENPGEAPAPVEQVGEHAPGQQQEPAREEPPPALSGVVAGRVLWSGPEPVQAPLARNAEPYCARLGEALDGSVSISNGGLAGVLVRLRALHIATPPPLPSKRAIAARRSSPSKPAAALPSAPSAVELHSTPAPTHLSLASCAFAPRVLGLSRGEHLVIESVDPILHAVRITRERSVVYRRTLQREQPAPELRFSEPGVYRVGCDVHPWEVAWVVVSPPEDTRAFAVSDAQGHFRIEGVAPGSFAVDAWHERAQISGAPVRIRAGAIAHAQLQAEPPVALAHQEGGRLIELGSMRESQVPPNAAHSLPSP